MNRRRLWQSKRSRTGASAVHMTRIMRRLYQLDKRGAAGRDSGSSQVYRRSTGLPKSHKKKKKVDKLHPDSSSTPLQLPAASALCTWESLTLLKGLLSSSDTNSVRRRKKSLPHHHGAQEVWSTGSRRWAESIELACLLQMTFSHNFSSSSWQIEWYYDFAMDGPSHGLILPLSLRRAMPCLSIPYPGAGRQASWLWSN